MPELDPSIALASKAPDGMKAISGMLSVAKDVQGMQAQRLAMTGQDQTNQNAGIALNERKGLQQVFSDPTKWQNADGTTNYNALIPQVMKIAPTTGMDAISKIASTEKQSTDSQSTLLGLAASQRAYIGQVAYSLQGRSASEVSQAFDDLAKQSPGLAGSAKWAGGIVERQGKAGQAAQDAALKRFGEWIQTSPEQQTMNTPSGVTVNDNQHTSVTSLKPGTSVPQFQPIPGAGATIQPPPTTPTMGGPNGTTPGIIGPSTTPAPGQRGAPQGNAQPAQGVPPSQDVNAAGHPAVSRAQQQSADTDRVAIYSQERQQLAAQAQQAQASGDPAAIARAQQDQANLEREIVSNKVHMPVQGQAAPTKQGGFMATGLDPGQSGNMEDNVNLMNTHYAKLSGNASDAQTALGLTENIKSLAAGAATGTYSGRKAFVAGLLNTMHLGGQMTGDLQKDTDLLEKNMAQLNLNTPASSDAGRALIAAARPHGTMGESSIIESADQIGAQIKSNLAVRNYLTPYKFSNGGKGDAQGYQSARQEIEGTADPRIWQLQGKSPAEQKAFMKSLTPSDQADLVKKSRSLHSMGIIQ
jgi:hypothetical protein